jgi:hypothetical protein
MTPAADRKERYPGIDAFALLRALREPFAPFAAKSFLLFSRSQYKLSDVLLPATLHYFALSLPG